MKHEQTIEELLGEELMAGFQRRVIVMLNWPEWEGSVWGCANMLKVFRASWQVCTMTLEPSLSEPIIFQIGVCILHVYVMTRNLCKTCWIFFFLHGQQSLHLPGKSRKDIHESLGASLVLGTVETTCSHVHPVNRIFWG